MSDLILMALFLGFAIWSFESIKRAPAADGRG